MQEAATLQANPTKGGRILRERRKDLDVTTSDLATVCEKTPTHISEIEHGRRTPSPELLEAICDQLKIEGAPRIEIFVLFGQMPCEVERYIDHHRGRIIRNVQRLILSDTKEGLWTNEATLAAGNGAARRKKRGGKSVGKNSASSGRKAKLKKAANKKAANKKPKKASSKKAASKKAQPSATNR
jgi:transcriptional regulator with XRE-family HTH domain